MGTGRLILHVDDREDEGFLLQRAVLGAAADWDLHFVGSGEAALEYLSTAKAGQCEMPRLVLVDIKMPKINGFQVLEWVQENLPQLPVAMLSSSDEPTDKARAAAEGAFRYFVKSSSFSEVIECLQNFETWVTRDH
ncbi:MAG: response regulator [Verrucomicrobia subdivision 3 bacterium]|nr:response regulator [Limisphaerales bacterium]